MIKNMNAKKISLGTCYYPEHWDKSLWEDDMKRMKESGIETIRIGEFAWSKFEPIEGEFNFDFFDDFMEVAKKYNMKVIFGTPTATPPAWLTEKYPEVLNADIEGNKYYHGARRHYNYNSPVFTEKSRIIVEKIAEHYGKHPSIIGWQIDNELNCELDEFYSKSDTVAFREFLKEKYKDLKELNVAWGTVFWNQQYTSWEQVYVPRKTVSNSVNPHQVLDYKRFISYSARRYCKMQSDIIKKYISSDVYVTTNGMFGNLDNHKMTNESLDFYMYDSYPNFAYCMDADPINSVDLNDRKWSRNLTEVRSISENFGIMEQQSGPNGWNTRMEAPAPKPGQMTLWTMQSIAHGSDFISYFRWRTATMGTEIYWHGILDYSGRDNRRIKEVKNIHEKVKSIEEIAGSKYSAEVAVLKDYDNIWDSELDKWHMRLEKVSQMGLFKASQLSHTPYDYIYVDNDLKLEDIKKYKVLFYPHPLILTKETVKLLEEYANQGGIVVFGCRTGLKDKTGKCVQEKLPGLAADISGTDVYEHTFVGPFDGEVYMKWGEDKVKASVFNDLLSPKGKNSKVIGEYTSNYYKGVPGLIVNKVGNGEVYYFGGAFDYKTAKVFLEKLQVINPYKKYIKVEKECEIAIREKNDEKYLFVLNYSNKNSKLTLKTEMKDMYSGNNIIGKMELKPYETKVFKMK